MRLRHGEQTYAISVNHYRKRNRERAVLGRATRCYPVGGGMPGT